MVAWTSTFASSQAWIALLYSGVMSCGVAYTLQIIGQNGLNPTLASMIMSLESVFSVLTGWLILDEQLGGREIMGCVLIFAAILLAQVPVGKKIKIINKKSRSRAGGTGIFDIAGLSCCGYLRKSNCDIYSS